MFRPFRRAAPASALLLSFLGGSAFTGCDSADSPSGPATVRLDVEALVGDDAFQAGDTFTVDGRAATLDAARLYLSDLTLLHEDGREIVLTADAPVTVRARNEGGEDVQHSITERYILVRAEDGRTVAALGEVPSGSYTGLRFTLGVNGLDNRIDITDLPAGHPLGDTGMYWDWNVGYIFLRLDGLLDVDGDGTPDPETGTVGDPASGQWRLHIGQTANAQMVTIGTPFTLEAGETQDLHLQVDLARFVQGVDYAVPANRFCMTFGCQPIVDQARANAQSAFSLHGVHHEHDV